MGEKLEISRKERKAVRLPWKPLLQNKAREIYVKMTGRRIKGQGMINQSRDHVREGFSQLQGEDFDEYNFPQAWVESRHIPQCLDNRVPRSKARIVDLGCGPGTSTRIICWFAQPDWEILGFDFIEEYVVKARDRESEGAFVNAEGRRIRPSFVAQDVAAPLRDPDGELLADASVDCALSGGVVGLYMNRESTERLADELSRILKEGAYAAIDAGPAVSAGALEEIFTQRGFEKEALAKSFVYEPRPKIIFRKR